MTDEELKKEAIKFAVDYPTSYGKGYKHKDLRIAYLAAAKPREERIAALDKENGKLEGKLADLQSEYIELENFHNNEVKGLKDVLESVESENVCLVGKLAFTENTLNNRIAQIEELETRCAELFLQNNEFAEQLTKAKEFIKGLLSCCRNYPQDNVEKIKEAEQFLKEIGK